jgi:hypothetical protein
MKKIQLHTNLLNNINAYWITSLFWIFCSISLNAQDLNQSEHKSQYSLSEIYDIRQSLDPKGFAYLTAPFWGDYVFELHETKDFVIVCCTNQLDVFDKKNKFWQLFTISDGFQPIRYPVKYTRNYEHYFVIRGASYDSEKDTSDIVNVFDKEDFKIFTITNEEYKTLSKKWLLENFIVDEDNKWYIEGMTSNNIIHNDKRSLQKSVYSTYIDGLNRIKEIRSNDNYCIIVQYFGIKTIDKYGTERLLNSSKGLYSDEVNSVSIYNDKLLVFYDSIVDIFQLDEFLLLKRLPIRSTISNVSFNDTLLFYTINSKFFITQLEGNLVIDSFDLDSEIKKLYYHDPQIILETNTSLSSFNLHTKETMHYEKNDFMYTPQYSYDGQKIYPKEYYYGNGELENMLVGIKHQGGEWVINKTVLFNWQTNQFINNIDSVIPPKIQEKINKYSVYWCKTVFFSNNFMLLSYNEKCSIYKINSSNTPYTFELMQEFELESSKASLYLPNVFDPKIKYPIGREITSFESFHNCLWIGTDRGLFSVDSTNNWISHFEPSNGMGYNQDMIVSDEGIYTSIGDRSVSRFWSRLDRKSFQHSNFHYSWPLWERGFKIKNNQLIAATQIGLLFFNFLTREYELIATDAKIRQVDYNNEKYIAASDSNIYEFDTNKKLTKTYPLVHAKKGLYGDAVPFTMDIDSNIIWFSSYWPGLRTKLTMYNMNSNERTDFLTSDSHIIIKVIPAKKDVWVFGEEFIHKYNKETSSLYCLGRVAHSGNGIAKIEDAYENDSLIYLSTTTGIYELNTETLSFRQSNIPVFSRFTPGSIVKKNNFYFINLGGGVLQMGEQEFEESFSENKNITLFHYNYDDNGIILPLSSDNKITINDKTKDQFYYIDFEKEIMENKLIIDDLHDLLKFKVYFENLELQIKCLGNQGNPSKSYFKIILPSDIFKSSSESNLCIYYTNESERKLIREFKVIVK